MHAFLLHEHACNCSITVPLANSYTTMLIRFVNLALDYYYRLVCSYPLVENLLHYTPMHNSIMLSIMKKEAC